MPLVPPAANSGTFDVQLVNSGDLTISGAISAKSVNLVTNSTAGATGAGNILVNNTIASMGAGSLVLTVGAGTGATGDINVGAGVSAIGGTANLTTNSITDGDINIAALVQATSADVSLNAGSEINVTAALSPAIQTNTSGNVSLVTGAAGGVTGGSAGNDIIIISAGGISSGQHHYDSFSFWRWWRSRFLGR